MTPDELQHIFMPNFLERAAPVMGGKRHVHYTSAEALFSVLKSRKWRLRNARLMNDFSEIQHGLSCLQSAWNSEAGIEFQKWIDLQWPQLNADLVNLFDGHAFGIQNRTFITSLSEHEDDEDRFGRLSMWRAYGGKSGVAIVLNPAIFASETEEMAVFSAPVLYEEPESFKIWFAAWAAQLESQSEVLSELPLEEAKGWLFYCFRLFCLCIKHPGFKEEKEWRVFHTPQIDGESNWISPKIETIESLPQEIFELSLVDDVELGVIGVAPDTLINRIIIGPCEAPMSLHYALISALRDAGVSDPESRISASLIPLRN
jgi:uncharacterized protein YukE